jgi:flagellar motility protein MotE (MotC chaperone)
MSFVCIAMAMMSVFDVSLFAGATHNGTARAQATSKQVEPVERPKAQLHTLTPGDIPLLRSLQERQDRLDALLERGKELDEREESLQLLQNRIEEKLSTLQILRKEISELLKEKDSFEEQRYEHLVKVYEGMKPEDAAILVEKLHEDTAIQLLSRMKSKKAGQVLGAIKPEKAARLSEFLATLHRQKTQGNAQ